MKRVSFANAEVADHGDFENIGVYAQQATDGIWRDALGYPAHWAGFTVARKSAQEVTISAGRYVAGQYIFDHASVTDLNLQLQIPPAASDQRWVATRPLSADSVSRTSSGSLVAKPVMGGRQRKENTGEGDDEITITGSLLPSRIGGLTELEILHAMRRAGSRFPVTSQGSRGGGRIVQVTAKGFDTRGKAKQAQAFHMDEANLGKFLGAVAKDAGFDLVMDSDLAEIERDYWSADYESFLDLGEKLAREVGGTFKIRGKQAVLVNRGENDLPTVYGVVGEGGNVISWDMAPFTGRSSYTKAEARWFDRKKAKFETETVEIDMGKEVPESSNIVRIPMGDKTQAKHRTRGRKSEAKRDAGVGIVTLDLAPEAQAEALFVLTGAKPDVDGNWRIDGVTHKADRGGGSITMLDLKEPGAKMVVAKSPSSKRSRVKVTKPAVDTETYPALPG